MKMEDVYTKRKERLRQVMNDEFDGKQVLLAAKLGKQPDYISRIFKGGKMLAEDLAREFEVVLGKPPYWLDGLNSKWPFERISPDRYGLLTENQKKGIEDGVLRQVDAFLGAPPGQSGEAERAA